MKRKTSTGVILCLGFLIVFSLHQISFWRSSRKFPMSSSEIKEEIEDWRAPVLNEPPINCDRSKYRYDLCTLNGPTVMNPTNSTFLIVDPTTQTPPTTQKIRPYPRKWETHVMSQIKELTLSTSGALTTGTCHFRHDAPALVFSSGGYTGNFWHDFNDGLVPLFVTIHSLFREDPILVIANCRNWWLTKYVEILRQLTRYPIISLDNETAVHCFPSVTFGLISHGDLSITPSLMPNSETLLDFRQLLDRSYSPARDHHLPPPTTRPRLVLVSRKGNVSRVILNQANVIRAAEEVGFNVEVFEPNKFTSLPEAYGLINRSHAMFGVHGAALTYSYFLRPGAVFIQVMPLGLDWVSENCFGAPAQQLGLDYMLYKIKVEESSLVEKYGKDDLVLKNPKAVVKNNWQNTHKIYLKNQDVRLDLDRVRKYLKVAYKKAKRFMEKEIQG
ncbi:xylan glycosyltransferase MUCI21-like isoform X1 [Tasmannia lanceolata]|uniref:xylan glycosyltransferase MUCI21-like isoform X1 n=1 Tax=Tasmannia lanceolata TaxID=3420 RepID=UPI004063D21A